MPDEKDSVKFTLHLLSAEEIQEIDKSRHLRTAEYFRQGLEIRNLEKYFQIKASGICQRLLRERVGACGKLKVERVKYKV